MKKYVTTNIKKNEIKMLLKHPTYKEKVILIVEGKSDIRLFRSLFNPRYFKIESVEGKIALLEVVDDLFKDFKNRVVGLRDADCDRLLAQTESDSILLTDLHDAEMMMLNSPALDNFINEFASHENFDDILDNLRKVVFSAAYRIGLVRLLSEAHGLQFIFKALTFSGFLSINKLDIQVDMKRMLMQLIGRSPSKPENISVESLLSLIEGEEGKNHCQLQVCCGHDVTKIMELMFSQSWVSLDRNLNQERIESSLRLSYSAQHFCETALYANIKARYCGVPHLLAS